MVDMTRVDEIIDRHDADVENLIAILLDCQEEFSHLPRELVEEVAEKVNVPVTNVLGVATFFRAFSLKPKGKFPVSVCTGTACHVLGAPRLIEAFERELGVKCGDTTSDGRFSIHTINCPGCCGLAPVITVGEEIHGKINQAAVPRIIKKYKDKSK